MSLRELVTQRREEILAIAAKYGASNVRVFGSVARGDADDSSDIDLLVDFRLGTTLIDHAALTLALERLFGRKVDVVSSRGMRERVRARVLSEAIRL